MHQIYAPIPLGVASARPISSAGNFSPCRHLMYNPGSLFLLREGSMEINPLLNMLTEMKKRTDVLRGYL